MAKHTPINQDQEFLWQNEAAVGEAREADRVEPRAAACRYDAERGLIMVTLRSGYTFGFSPDQLPGLESAAEAELSDMRVSPSGDGLHWGALDVDASLTGLIAEALNLREWAPRLMGQVRSEAKARAARLNGMKGGRPRRGASSSRSSKKAP